MNRGQREQQQLKKLITLACHGQEGRERERERDWAKIPKHKMTASLIHSEIFLKFLD